MQTANNRVSTTIDIYILGDISLQAFWVMDFLTTTKKDRFTAFEITNYLVNEKGIPTSRQEIVSRLSKEKKYCQKNENGYKLMKAGEETLSGSGKVVYIEPGKPYTAKYLKLKDIVGNINTEISICDPYLDNDTLNVIYHTFNKGIPIRILTVTINDNPKGTVRQSLGDLVAEGYKVEVRQYSSSVLHDRYIMDKFSFWYCGNSLNGLGKKESFIVQMGNDIWQTMYSTFNGRWKTSKPF